MTGIVRFPQDVDAVLPLVDRQGVWVPELRGGTS